MHSCLLQHMELYAWVLLRRTLLFGGFFTYSPLVMDILSAFWIASKLSQDLILSYAEIASFQFICMAQRRQQNTPFSWLFWTLPSLCTSVGWTRAWLPGRRKLCWRKAPGRAEVGSCRRQELCFQGILLFWTHGCRLVVMTLLSFTLCCQHSSSLSPARILLRRNF